MTVSVSLLFCLSFFLLAWKCRLLPSAFSSSVWALSSAKSRFLDICLQARLRISAQKYFFFFFLTCTHTQKTKMSDLNPISLTECKGRQGGLWGLATHSLWGETALSTEQTSNSYRACIKKTISQHRPGLTTPVFLKEKKKTKGKSKKTEKKPSVLPYYCAFLKTILLDQFTLRRSRKYVWFCVSVCVEWKAKENHNGCVESGSECQLASADSKSQVSDWTLSSLWLLLTLALFWYSKDWICGVL